MITVESVKRMQRITLVLLVLGSVSPTAAQPRAVTPAVRTDARVPPEARLRLDVLLVNDPDFPRVTRQAADAILEQARRTLSDKLAFDAIEFVVKDSTTVADFFSRHVDAKNDCMRQFEPHRVRPGIRPAASADRELVRKFLERWELESLRSFFNNGAQAELGGYDAIRSRLLAEFDRKVAKIARFSLPNGESLLAPDKLDQRSYVSWICAVRAQDEADLILTNAFILYDLASEPYPHSIFAKCKVGGASLLSPKRQAIRRRAVVASTFSMVTDLEFFKEEGVETLDDAERLKVIGTFIVAHELGHAVFKIPDFYDHPPECLMTTKYETGYVSGYRELQQHPGPCPMCQPYVDAKRQIFLAQSARELGDYEAVVKHLMAAIASTPHHIDGSRTRYLVELSVDLAEAYAAMGEGKTAKRWLQSALLRVPDHERAKALESSLEIPAHSLPTKNEGAEQPR